MQVQLAVLAALLLAGASSFVQAKEKDNHLLYDEFLKMPDDLAMRDGIWWKARNAARFAQAAADVSAMSTMPVDYDALGVEGNVVEFNVGLDGGSQLQMLAASTDRYDLILAFATDGSIEASDDDDMDEMDIVTEHLLNGTKVNGKALDLFMAFAGAEENNITAIAKGFHSNPRRPVNVLCTGANEAAALVPICAVYAAFAFPQAHILAETFNGTWPASNGRFNWTFSQMVDQFYLWPSDVSGYKEGELAETGLVEALDTVEVSEANLFANANDLAEEIALVLDDATTVLVIAPNGTDLTSRGLPPITGNLTGEVDPIPMQGAGYNSEQMNFTIDKYYEVENECPPVLCKTRFPGFMAGMIYAEYDPEDPEWIGPVPLDRLMEGEDYVRVKGDHDADGAVLYNETTDTAYFIWRGSESDADWRADFNVIENDWPVENGAERIWDDPEVQMGFLQQFGAITDLDADDDSTNVQKQLMEMTGGRTPRMIVCVGQSLGGALSTLCGGYMANAYPNATVLVFNEGSPKTGDEQWVKYLNQHVGRLWRMVNEADQVPLLAPFDYMKHAGRGMWIHDAHVYLDERPPMAIKDTNWNDHNYYYYSIAQDTIANVSAPKWVYDEL
jgi:hypothetical protein